MPAATDTDELAALRAEIAALRRDLDRALERLDLPNSLDPTEGAEWANMAFSQVSVRHSRRQIPVILHSGTDESGLLLYDANQRLRGRFGVDTNGQARLEILNAEGKVAASIGEGGGGRGEVRANDADGTPRAGIKASELGGVLSVVNPQGRVLAAVTSNDEGGMVFICSPGLQPVVTLQSATGGGALLLAEPSGQTMGSFVVTPLGTALSVYGELGTRALTLSGLSALPGTLTFYDTHGEVVTTLPWDLPERGPDVTSP